MAGPKLEDVVREREVEKYLIRQVEKAGGLCLKWTGPAGVPDRVVTWPDGATTFVEVKAPNGRLSPRQEVMIQRLRDRGQDVRVVWGRDDVDLLVADYPAEKIVE